jgi:23S rRNA (cytosine1962-C5)-methyltransferase
MDVRKEAIAQALREVLRPKGAVLRAEGRMRSLEGLPDERGVWFGEAPETVEIDELGVRFRVDVLGGQKTGHFFDQAENRRTAGALCRDRTVLDAYCNTGGFALQALRHGAKSALGIDASADTLARAVENAALNGFGERFSAECSEAYAALDRLLSQGRRFGAVLLDPPAFAKSRKAAAPALVGYRDLNTLGLRLVEDDGFLVTSSCSYHIEEERFVEAVREAAARANRRLRLVRRGEQAADHPVSPDVPESRYLKHFVFHVLSR